MRRLAALAAALWAGIACGHPLGNNTVNREAWIEVSPTAVAVHYLMDMAEIPTLLAAQEADADGDGATSAAEWDLYAQRGGEEILAGVALSADGALLAPRLEVVRSERVAGAAGLATLRLVARLSAPLERFAMVRIGYRDLRRPDEVGWKAVIASAGEGVRIARSDVPAASLSRGLESYPAEGGAIPNVLSATIEAQTLPLTAPEAPRLGALAATAASSGSADRRAAAPSASPSAAFFRLGLYHIANGLDHLVFLLGLMWTQRSLRGLAWVITAFTAAHSLTLGLAAAGLLAPPTAWVQPAIGLTIAYVGIANLGGRLRHGPAVAFGFGLIHGFGFASVLATSLGTAQVGSGGWLLDLALFNLGVEAGQLAFVLAVLLLARALRALEVQWTQAARLLSGYLVGLLGAYWTLQPLLGAWAGSR